MNDHKQWLDNEYRQWCDALNECSVHNFKSHPMVNRMLGHPDEGVWGKVVVEVTEQQAKDIIVISNIGRSNDRSRIQRMLYYAREIISLNPSSIVEIGGGVGQFYAILRALGYVGAYYIYDLPEVKAFQHLFLHEAQSQTNLPLVQVLVKPVEMVVSFYAYGEFDDRDKKTYWDHVISKANRGYIVWNPHSGASSDYSFIKHDITVTLGLEPGIKIIKW